MKKKHITQEQAIEVVKTYAVPNDYGCQTWDEVLEISLTHADGLAVALGIDNEYTIDY